MGNNGESTVREGARGEKGYIADSHYTRLVWCGRKRPNLPRRVTPSSSGWRMSPPCMWKRPAEDS